MIWSRPVRVCFDSTRSSSRWDGGVKNKQGVRSIVHDRETGRLSAKLNRPRTGYDDAKSRHGPLAGQCVSNGCPARSAWVGGSTNGAALRRPLQTRLAGRSTCPCEGMLAIGLAWQDRRETRRKCERGCSRQIGAMPTERALDGAGEHGAFKFKLLGQKPQVVEVLHAAVGHAERDHRLKLFRNDCFARVGQNSWCRKFQTRRILDLLRVGSNWVAKANVHLNRPCALAAAGLAGGLRSPSYPIGFDRLATNGVRQELQAIVRDWLLDIPRGRSARNVGSNTHRYRAGRGPSLVGVAAGPSIETASPLSERTCRDAGTVRGGRAIVPRRNVAGQAGILPRFHAQDCSAADAPRRAGCAVFSRHTSDSRYGRMTLATRQTLAACQSWSIVARRFFQQSRRASRATSSPTLLRYLKQSATVFAGL